MATLRGDGGRDTGAGEARGTPGGLSPAPSEGAGPCCPQAWRQCVTSCAALPGALGTGTVAADAFFTPAPSRGLSPLLD